MGRSHSRDSYERRSNEHKSSLARSGAHPLNYEDEPNQRYQFATPSLPVPRCLTIRVLDRVARRISRCFTGRAPSCHPSLTFSRRRAHGTQARTAAERARARFRFMSRANFPAGEVPYAVWPGVERRRRRRRRSSARPSPLIPACTLCRPSSFAHPAPSLPKKNINLPEQENHKGKRSRRELVCVRARERASERYN